ncbi:MAG TPA: glycosyltransferase family 39 protein [Fimbriiglobus sp.]|nr:glycosyltransferase family 39 protein [Fimbriiglobus sp.]
MRRNWWAGPTAVAVALTILNAVKPVVVDDTAYLLFARHIADRPLDPYGFELFWYRHPQPAMEVLAPPVVPYWLAAGVALFGEHLVRLKLWLLPFPLVLCFAARSLLRRFARGTEQAGLVLIALSPAVLPLVNFMLDVPAVALGLASVAVFVRGCDRKSWRLVLAAGVLAGAATQTKYTMMTVPAALLWYGVLHRRVRYAAAAGAVAVGMFAAWEGWLVGEYGVSHFLYHLRDQQSGGGGLSAWVGQKIDLVNPLLGFLGGLACATGLYAGRGVGFGRRFVAVVALVAALGMIAVCLVPYSNGVLLKSRTTGSPRLDLPAVVFYPLGVCVLTTLAAAVTVLAFRPDRGPLGWLRRHPATWFLIGWLGIELAAYFVLTPFPAGRRVIAVCVVLGLIACRLVSRIRRIRPGRTPERWIIVYAVGLGAGLFTLDTWDALPERQLAYQASEMIGDRKGGRVWTQGHWGWQYYTDRLGMTLVDPGHSELRAGDWLVLPVPPDEKTGFFRPYHGEATFRLDPEAVEIVGQLWWDDWIAGQTIPNLYGGVVPVIGRDHPRLRVAVYRITRDWVPTPR